MIYEPHTDLRLLMLNMNTIQGNGFIAEIISSAKRTTVGIKIHKGKVIIMAPESLNRETVELLVAKKSRWIREKLALQQDIIAIKPKKFITGEVFFYLGKDHVLKIEAGPYPSLTLHEGELVVSVRDNAVDNSKMTKQLLIKWYQQQAQLMMVEKTRHYAQIIGVSPSAVVIKSFKSRWGSCNIKGVIQYNWKIIMAPEPIINYLVVHELSHILHHNHSPAFWKVVATYCPNYKEQGVWLKLNGARLEV
ncbi:MAG: M48 family peptidase [Methylococcales bacterium]|nr:MAG: M48 family peptidase [Methylococcales bacterium]